MNNRLSIYRLATVVLMLLLTTAFVPAPPGVQSNGGQVDLTFGGVITEIAGDNYTIAGIDVLRTAATHYKLTTDTLETGMWADVMGSWEEDTLVATKLFVKPAEVLLRGPIQFRPEGDLGEWVIAGQTIVADENTRFCNRCGSVDPPAWAEVHAIENSEGQLVADRIAGIEMAEWIEVYGAIQMFDDESWTLSTIVLSIEEGTTVAAGEGKVGVLAHARAMLNGEDTLVALKLKPVWIEPGVSGILIVAPLLD